MAKETETKEIVALKKIRMDNEREDNSELVFAAHFRGIGLQLKETLHNTELFPSVLRGIGADCNLSLLSRTIAGGSPPTMSTTTGGSPPTTAGYAAVGRHHAGVSVPTTTVGDSLLTAAATVGAGGAGEDDGGGETAGGV
ncbi:hypothetical protein BRADI_4g23920v3 [Brachypodium distachyon]|uniref:Uncharacterized protein n=1 Tax=Brachypodium distachyon TaxID=15368 RepID=I1IN00_BRADI|nr:hypothetical protein BRADI_4g23920v3 [Brachypodium distachyon]